MSLRAKDGKEDEFVCMNFLRIYRQTDHDGYRYRKEHGEFKVYSFIADEVLSFRIKSLSEVKSIPS